MRDSREMEAVPGLAVTGCDFRLASSRWRSRLVLDERELMDLADELVRSAEADGFVDLVTCNRVEWIVSTARPRWTAQLLRAQMLERLGEGKEGIEPYVHVGEDAARHVFSVSIGQESFVPGERQIATQLFRALEQARTRGTTSRLLNGLGSITGRLVRDAVREGCIGGPAAGVHSLAYHHVLDWLEGRIEDPVVAVVGLGAIGRLVRNLFEENTRTRVIPVNRTIPAGEQGRVRSIRELSRVLGEVDAAVICTSAPHPVVKAATLQGRDATRPLLVLDLGIPEQVGELDPARGAVRAGLDDLTAEPARVPHREEQKRHEQAARELLDRAVQELAIFDREGNVVEVFDDVRRCHDRFVNEEIPRFIEERVGGLDESQKAHLAFGLKGMVIEYTNDVFRSIKRSLSHSGQEEEEDWNDTP